MKNLLYVLIMLPLMSLGQVIEFEDDAFKRKLLIPGVATDSSGSTLIVDANGDGQLEVVELTRVYHLNFQNTYFRSISDLRYFTNLETFKLINNLEKITSISIYGLKNLKEIVISNSSNTFNATIYDLPNLESLNINYCRDLTSFSVEDLPKLKTLTIFDNLRLGEVMFKEGLYSLQDLKLWLNNDFTVLDLSIFQSTLKHIDIKGNINEIMLGNSENLETIKILSYAIQEIDFSSANNLRTLDLFNCRLLEHIYLPIELLLLENVNISNTSCLSFDLSHAPILKYFYASSAKLKELDLSKLKDLKVLDCSYNDISKLNFSALENIVELNFADNNLTEFDVSMLKNLKKLNCSDNNYTTLDLSNLKDLEEIRVYDCRFLEYINLKNGKKDLLNLFGNKSLKHICIDDFELDEMLSNMDEVTKNQVSINAYCNFQPGGETFLLKVKKRFGDEYDFKAAHFRFKYMIESDSQKRVVIPKSSSDDLIWLESGTQFAITPYFLKEKVNSLFSFTPQKIDLNTDVDENYSEVEITASPIKEVNDLEVYISPVGIPAIPGFDSRYKIVVANTGSKNNSGRIKLDYFDDVLDYVEASQGISDYGDYKLYWDFEDLKPFETKEIIVTFNVNSPQETPAVNNGELLNFTATIEYDGTDETPEDNSHTLRQTVVNSYDPNDKTCLEGNEILPEMVGEYLHYRIRFENTGTFPAQNIVVVDEIDESKFDVSTLIPIDSSHDMQTKITGNKVEFIFENIMLPFEDETNDGFVVFKIKTLPTLKVGDSFSNQASIYFDFNFPIITNNETTTIVQEHLGVSDFEFNQELTVYPNPVADRLYITSKSDAKIQSLDIYNLQGQLIQTVPKVTKMSFDVSHLPKGTYIVKVGTDKGEANTKIVKD